MATDYTTVTELPGCGASREQLRTLYHRYRTASRYCEGKDILEVGCGAGQGLGYLAKRAKRVVGGDYTEANLRYAREYYKERAKLVCLDAHHLPFSTDSFDVVILFEAIYYLVSPEKFLEESRRLLRSRGVLIVCTVNKDWSDFNPSPFCVRYFSGPELVAMLRQHDFEVELFGAFPAATRSLKDKFVSIIKRMAITLHLIPKTMKRKEIFKRIFFGKLSPVPAEIEEGMVDYIPPAPISCEAANYEYKVLYAVARLC